MKNKIIKPLKPEENDCCKKKEKKKETPQLSLIKQNIVISYRYLE